MRFKPILFSTEMVRAILEGRKTQTRRIVKLKHLDPKEVGAIHPDGSGKGWIAWSPGRSITAEYTRQVYSGNDGFACPYGAVGDVLWVRESFIAGHEMDDNDMFRVDDSGHLIEKVWYKADGEFRWFDGMSFCENVPWKPSIHMPKSACRIFLQITDIRVERLQDISEEDAKAEGVRITDSGDSGIGGIWFKDYITDDSGYGHPDHDFAIVSSAIESFGTLWQKINGADSWKVNPWVWMISFKHIDEPEGFV